MMREIKFRAWDAAEERFWSLQDGGEESGDGSVQFFGNNQGVLEIGRLESFDVGLGIKTEFTAFPLSQYTGLKDKNGAEIYEGDVLLYKSPLGSGRESKVVCVYEEGCFNFGGIRTDYVIANSQIIGNTYENPKLLKED